jgi:hypothetical protein
MTPTNDDDEIIAVLRDRSRRLVQTVFAAFVIIFAGLALAANNAPDMFQFPAEEMPRIASAFLALASGYALIMFAWDWLFGTTS